ncbi:Sclerostin domain-containing protein 1 [Mactra antiquata]
MYQCWTLVVIVIMLVPYGRTAVANLPPTSSETKIENYDILDKAHDHERDSLALLSTDMPADVQLGCKELRAKRYISDGFCTSLKAIKEVVCAGHCMPIKEQDIPWWAEFTKYWAIPKYKEWRCVDAVVKLKKVQLMCKNGETRSYKIKIVKSCRCKSYEREPNRTEIHKPTRPELDVEREKKRLERIERKRLKREKRLEKEKERRNKRNLRKSSRETRKHRHSGDKERRHRRRRHKNDKNEPTSTKVDETSDTRHTISQTNNESPTV